MKNSTLQPFDRIETLLKVKIVKVEKFIDHSAKQQSESSLESTVSYRFTVRLKDSQTAPCIVFSYDPQDMPKTLKELKRLALLDRISDRRPVIDALLDVNDLMAPSEFIQVYHVSRYTGWHYIDNSWYYLTSSYGICKSGVKENYYSLTNQGFLLYDSTLSEPETHCRLIGFLESAPKKELFPLISMGLLSILEPLKRNILCYSTPGCLIRGESQCGKTELAIRITRFLTNENGQLGEVFILQDSAKLFNTYYDSLYDCTVILDDNRKSHSYRIRENSHYIMDTIMRKSYSENSVAAVPIITGESNSFYNMPDSWLNRMIHIFLRSDEESKKIRRSIIRYIKQEHPLLLRTCYRYFIQYIAGALEDKRFQAMTIECEDSFSRYFPRLDHSTDREYDNLLLSFWAFKIYLEYGVSLKILTSERRDDYLKEYAEILQELFTKQIARMPEKLAFKLFVDIINQMRIRCASENLCCTYDTFYMVHTYGYRHQTKEGTSLKNCYGHQILFKKYGNIQGIFLPDSSKIYDYPKFAKERSFLIVKKEDFENNFEYCKYAIGKEIPEISSFNLDRFKEILRERGILLGIPRSDDNPNHFQWSLRYPPRGKEDRYPQMLGPQTVYVFSITEDFKKALEKTFVKNIDEQESFYSLHELEQNNLNFSWIDILAICGEFLGKLL